MQSATKNQGLMGGVRIRVRLPSVAIGAALVVALGGAQQAALAGEIPVSDAAEVLAASKRAKPGDVLVMREGTWTDQDIRFEAKGSASAPIVLRPARPGKVVLNGTSRLEISGDWLVADGLRFEGGALKEGQSVVRFGDGKIVASHSRLTNSAIIRYNPADMKIRYPWVTIVGPSNRVDHNRFEGQTNQGVTVYVPHKDNLRDNAVIEFNHFVNRPAGKGNGFETVRVGLSTVSLSDSGTIIRNNLFERTNGEMEAISIKSGANQVLNNTFREVQGTVTLRHGDGNVVAGNYFIGDNVAETGGIRVMGGRHKIYNNYLENVAGRDGGAIVLHCGDAQVTLAGNAPVSDVLIAHNTIVNSQAPALKLDAGCNTTNRPKLPANVRVLNNLISGNALPIDGQEGAGVLWRGNVVYGKKAGEVAAARARSADPKWSSPAGTSLKAPASDSPVVDVGDTTERIDVDIEGRRRDAKPDAGADERSAGEVVRRALTKADVGPAWLKD